MVDTIVVEELTGRTLNPTTAEYVDVYTTRYSGPGRVQLRDTLATLPDGGERAATIVRTIVSLPISATGLEPGFRVRVSAAVSDPDLVGKVYRLRSLADKTHATARRLECEETQA